MRNWEGGKRENGWKKKFSPYTFVKWFTFEPHDYIVYSINTIMNLPNRWPP